MKSVTADIPLRDTTSWAGYRKAGPIPLRVGACGGEALQYDGTRQNFVWNGVASGGIHTVLVGDQRVTNWRWENAPDDAGVPVTFIRFSEPVAEGLAVVARGRGALHPVRGGVIENPADAIWFFLAHIGGADLPAARLAAFRQQCADLPIGGSVETVQQLYAIARSICDSVGAICSPDMLGFARLWPEFDGPAVATIGDDVTVESKMEQVDVITDLAIWYAWEAGQPRGAVEYRTVRTPATGRRAKRIDAPWITSSRVASIVCQRRLRLLSRRQYVVSVRDARGDLRLGQAVELAHALIPATGAHTLLEREYSIGDDGERTSFTARAPIGAVPELKLERNTNASEPLPALEIVAAQLGAEFTVTIVDDETGDVLADAVCTLDGVVTRRADSAGRVTFPSRYATRGDHTIVAEAPGRDPVTLVLTVL